MSVASSTQLQSKPQWLANLQNPPPARSKPSNVADPLGFPGASGSKKQKESKSRDRKTPTQQDMDTLKLKKAWEVALAPIKQLPMTAIMMYMSGNSLQIFTIMTVFMAFKNPIVGLLSTGQIFERFQTETNRPGLLQVKLAYIAMQLVALGLGIWKINSMGLLPTTRSDWLAWEAAREPLERAFTAF